jgi:hypothetical protein
VVAVSISLAATRSPSMRISIMGGGPGMELHFSTRRCMRWAIQS